MNADNTGAYNVDDENDADVNSEDDSVNGNANSYNSEDDAVNGDTDTDGFGADNYKANNAGTDNADDDIDTADADDADAGSNDNGYPDDTDAQNDTALLSGVIQSCLDLVILVVYVHLKP